MSSAAEKFLTEAENVAFDLEHREKIRFNIGKYDSAVEKGKKNTGILNLQNSGLPK